MRLVRNFLWLLPWGGLAVAASAATSTHVRLLLAAETARPGETVWAGVELTMTPRWHTYWRNGGDAGGPTRIEWTLPAGIAAGEIQWPVPEKLVTGPVTTYVYHNRAVLLVPLSLATDIPPGSLELKANVSWLECEEVCLLGSTTVTARLTVGSETRKSPEARILEEARKRLPEPGSSLGARIRWEPSPDGQTRPVVFEWPMKEPIAKADFFPYASDTYEVQAMTERLPDRDGVVRFRKQVLKLEGDWPEQLSGLLVRRSEDKAPWQGYAVTLGSPPPGAESPAFPGWGKVLVMLAFGFLGGLILNIMPCVLPVIALKVLGFVQQAREEPRRVRQLGWIYGGGVLVSFLVLAGITIGIQRAGGLAGWGVAFQNPQFRVVITVLMTLVALNLFGVFEVTMSSRALGAASEWTARPGAAGAFLNGVLATLLATPCVAPFFGLAVAFALTQSALMIVVMFLVAGVGMALPFVVLCLQPAWRQWLPKPGSWMVRFKVAMGFPMLATAVWLYWGTSQRMGKLGALWFAMFLVILALAAWIWGEFVQRGSRRRRGAAAVSLLLVIAGYGAILEGRLDWRESADAGAATIAWQPWSETAVAAARQNGHPVLVDFTADLCVNCLVNKLTSLEIEATRRKLKQINAVAMIGDYTNQDPAIGRQLQRYGRPGVPLVLVYPADPGREPIVLPPVLTPGIVLEALDQATK